MKIIGISGRKQSGKNTAANYITGTILSSRDMVEDFRVNTEGKLEIKTANKRNEKAWGVFDPTRKDLEFIEYAENELWPYTKVYHFADQLKDLSIKLMGLPPEKVYGSDKQKNSKINVLWETMPENTEGKKGRMTVREFLQHFGTNVMRKMKDDIWVKATINKIISENSEVAIIPDVRFPNEVEAIRDNGGIVLRLTRDIFRDKHKCESSLDKSVFDWSNFDYVVENSECSVEDMCKKLDSIQEIWSN